ncbi:MAG: tetratricopeptide repeat protein [Ignavibacteriae bacterium]|nr:tetratricopeptide repeat protein [Ignavibacteriota bacterium]
MKTKVIYFVLIFTIVSISYTQDWQKYYIETLENLSKGDNVKALNSCRMALTFAQREFGESSDEYINTLGKLSSIYYSIGDYYKAIDSYGRQKDIISKYKGKNNEEYTKALNNLSASYQKLGRYIEAEPILLETIEIKKNLFGEHDT